MKILKKGLNLFKKNYDLTESSVKFYNNTKKRFFRKVGIVGTCIVCVFAPINNSYMQVKALTGIEETMLVGGILGILGLCGIGVAEEASESIVEFADNAYKGFCSFGETLVGTVKDKWDTLVNGAVTTGTVALDMFNSLTGELGNFAYNFFNTPSGGGSGGTTGIDILDLAFGVSVASLASGEFLLDNKEYIRKVEQGNYFFECTKDNTAYTIYSDFCNINIFDNGTFHVFNGSGRGDVWSFSNSSTGTYSKLLSFINFPISYLAYLTFDSRLKVNFNYGQTTLTLDGGKWTLGDLELDPPMYPENPDLKLLDESYLNYGDINDIALPRYVGPDATVVDGVVTHPGTWAIPNTYNPTLDNYKPVPLPFPLPNVGTVDGTYTGDLTTDTPWTDTLDKDIINQPDYVPPVIGDFLGDTDVPGKLNWKEYFPFCLPFDLIKFLGVLAAFQYILCCY